MITIQIFLLKDKVIKKKKKKKEGLLLSPHLPYF